MENKVPEKKKRDLLNQYLKEQSERLQGAIYYWGCMGAIVFITFLVRWLVGLFKGF
jgi:uncharacterized membrane protein